MHRKGGRKLNTARGWGDIRGIGEGYQEEFQVYDQNAYDGEMFSFLMSRDSEIGGLQFSRA